MIEFQYPKFTIINQYLSPKSSIPSSPLLPILPSLTEISTTNHYIKQNHMSSLNHPIVEESFAIIDAEVGKHNLNPEEYAITRRVIHATADFEFLNLLSFTPNAIKVGRESLQAKIPIITDVSMVKQGISSLVGKTFNNPIITAVQEVSTPLPNKTLTETGILHCFERYPQSIYVFGNAPTGLLALCKLLSENPPLKPPLIIGAPVGFVNVVESKEALAKVDSVSKICVKGRKGGSSVAAAIINALLILSWEDFLSKKQEVINNK